MTSALKVWSDALRLLQDEIPDFAFEAWIAPLDVKISDARIVLGCPTSFHRERVRIHLSDAITRCWSRAWASQPDRVDDPSAMQSAPTVAIVDGKEFAAAEGQRIELSLPVRRPERVAVASGAILERRAAQSMSRAVGEAPHADGITASTPNGTPNGMTSGAPAAKTLQSVPERSPRPARAGRRDSSPRPDVLRVEARPPLALDGEPVQVELPFSFESFVVGPCNALAREAALALARRRQSSLNQLYLGGESGMGKTHLARAAAAEARRQVAGAAGSAAFGSHARTGQTARGGIVYTTAEQFTHEFVSAMRTGHTQDFQKRYRAPIGLLIVEDVQFFDGRMKTQLELFHTVQHVLDAGGRVLLTGDRSPRDLKGFAERVRAQLCRGFVAELERPDAIVRRHILRTKAAAGGVHLPADCLDLLVDASSGSVRDIEGMLIQVVTTASLLGRPIDLALTREAIDRKAGIVSAIPTRSIETGEIVRIVASFFGRRPEALVARSRRRDVLIPRQLAMYLAHRYTDASFAEIGRSLGRDHPAVRNAIGRIERLVLEKAPLRYQVEALCERIDQRIAKGRAGSES